MSEEEINLSRCIIFQKRYRLGHLLETTYFRCPICKEEYPLDLDIDEIEGMLLCCDCNGVIQDIQLGLSNEQIRDVNPYCEVYLNKIRGLFLNVD